MKTIVAEHYGLCFGVRDAIAHAENLARSAPVTILGELAHNPLVRQHLARAGAREGSLADPASVRTPRVMITAHGASDADRTRWEEAGFEVSDGTCPLVRHAHTQLQRLVQSGCFPVVVGKRGHVEVNGLIGDFPEAHVLESEAEVASLPPRESYGVVSQTTQPIEKALAIADRIRRTYPGSEVKFIDTVCQPTKNRQIALRRIIAEADTVVIVGGRNSNNTLQLVAAVEVAGRRAIHIEQAGELESAWFRESRIVGLTAGTSTLKETVESVRQRLEEIGQELEAAAK